MGWKYEVYGWKLEIDGWGYREVYQGQSLIKAILSARKAKRTSGCVKIEWRG